MAADLYCYSNNGISMRCVPASYTPVTGEQTFSAPQNPTQLAAAFSGYAAAATAITAQEQIIALESSITLRMMREAFLGSTVVISDPASPYNGLTAAQAITSVQTQIATLRAEL